MEMIIGGGWQGKGDYAKRLFPERSFSEGGELTREALFQAEGVLNLHAFIRREMEEGREVTDLAESLIRENPTLVFTSQELGYGLVPMNAFDREYREAVGRICTRLAAASRRVTRVVCGLPAVLKDEPEEET